jgi:hypothetical protein
MLRSTLFTGQSIQKSHLTWYGRKSYITHERVARHREIVQPSLHDQHENLPLPECTGTLSSNARKVIRDMF